VNEQTRIRAVRGPISRWRALSCGAKCPPVYGDPAVLLPRFFSESVEPSRDIGYIPHYVDQWRVRESMPGAFVINTLSSVEAFVAAVRSCRRIVASALHGIIVAHAFGIPAAWVQWSDSIGGDGTKYRDYFASVGLDNCVLTWNQRL